MEIWRFGRNEVFIECNWRCRKDKICSDWKSKLCQGWENSRLSVSVFFKAFIQISYHLCRITYMLLFFTGNLFCPRERKCVRIVMVSVLCFPTGSTVLCTIRFRQAKLSFRKSKRFHFFRKLREELLFVMPAELLYVMSNCGSSSSSTSRCKFFFIFSRFKIFFFGKPFLFCVLQWQLIWF